MTTNPSYPFCICCSRNHIRQFQLQQTDSRCRDRASPSVGHSKPARACDINLWQN